MLNTKNEPPASDNGPHHRSGGLKSRFSRSSVEPKKAEDCLPSDGLNQLRAEVVGKTLTDDVSEVISAALGLGQRIRSKNLYIDHALDRLQFVVSCALQEKPQLVMARDELLRMQVEIYQSSGFISGPLARISGGSSTVLVLVALLASLFIWAAMVIGIRLLIDVRELALLRFHIPVPEQVSEIFRNVFFMDERALLIVASAAFIGGIVSIATRLSDFAKVRGLDPFAMFWTALLKPLIGVVLSIFILAALAGEVFGFGFLGKDPLGLTQGDKAIEVGSMGMLTAKTAYILWVVGFLAGFSERFASDFVQRTEGIASSNVSDDKSKK